ncbi:hypothetical protein BREVNS_1127 [Brevinematales bacterium NS]|nr:hypothetical protein BREVNS_1127 [Brevinematales bacterium NS]
MKNESQREKIFWENKAFWLLFLLNFLSFSSHAALNTLPVYLAKKGFSRSFTGLFMNIHVFGLVLFVVFLLPLVERVGKKRMMVFSYGLELFAYFGMFVGAWDMRLLVGFRVLSALSYAVGFTVNAALAFDVLPPEKRTGGIALFGISGILSNPFCAWMGQFFVTGFPRGLFLLGALLTLFALSLVFFVEEKSHTKDEYQAKHLFDVLKRKDLWEEFLLAMVLGGAFGTLATFVPLQTMERLGASFLTVYFVAYSLTAIGCRFFFSPEMDRFSSEKLLLMGFALVFFAMGNMAILLTKIQVVFTGILYGVGHTILYPVLSALVVKQSQEGEKYITNSVFIGFYTLGGFVFPSGLGVVGDWLSTKSIFWGMAIGAGVAFLWLLMGRKREEKIFN